MWSGWSFAAVKKCHPALSLFLHDKNLINIFLIANPGLVKINKCKRISININSYSPPQTKKRTSQTSHWNMNHLLLTKHSLVLYDETKKHFQSFLHAFCLTLYLQQTSIMRDNVSQMLPKPVCLIYCNVWEIRNAFVHFMCDKSFSWTISFNQLQCNYYMSTVNSAFQKQNIPVLNGKLAVYIQNMAYIEENYCSGEGGGSVNSLPIQPRGYWRWDLEILITAQLQLLGSFL